jgi:uncharacterized protein (DUF305 family)
MASINHAEPLPVEEPPVPHPAPSRRFRLLIVIGAMLIFALVALYALTNNNPFAATTTVSPEAGFARDMIVHHDQAVELAILLYDRTQKTELHQIALDIILSQQNQIGQMQGWLYLWNLPTTGTDLPMAWMNEPVQQGLMPGMATDEQIASLRAATGVDAERLFLQLMIPHHQSALHMAQAILDRTSIPAVQNLARSMYNSQSQEITLMQSILDGLPKS